MNCIFCRIVKGEAPSYTVYEDDETMVFLDIYPVSKGHLLVIPKRHYDTLDDVPNKILSRVWILASAIGKLYRVRFNASGVNIVTNVGRAAGQEVFHFHIHVIPRWGRWTGFWSGRHKLTEDEAKEVMDMWSNSKDELLKILGGD